MGITERIENSDSILDGQVILRYTHAFKKGGGVERYLEDLNTALLQRNRMTIIQFYLPDIMEGKWEEEDVRVGKGRLITIPLKSDQKLRTDSLAQNKADILLSIAFRSLKRVIRDGVVYNYYFPQFLRKLTVRKKYSRYNQEPMDVVEKFKYVSEKYRISAIVIHAIGGKGASEVIGQARETGIPYLLLNHFSNRKFRILGFREQARLAAGVGGVSSKDVPRYLRPTFNNLSDGIDTEFFKKKDCDKPDEDTETPIILLPARVVPGKGHADLLHAANQLIRAGQPLEVVFAGREDMPKFKQQLMALASELNIDRQVCFVGDLTQAQIREWYSRCHIVVLPSYNEGLGRVLIESQAMEKAVVAYDVGGVSEAMIDRRTGYLIRPGEKDGLALSIRELVSNDHKRWAMGKEGRAFVERTFSREALARRHEEWYATAIRAFYRR